MQYIFFIIMGVICPLSPEIRVLNKKNDELERVIKAELQDLRQFEFPKSVMLSLRKLDPRYKYNFGILEDIEKLHSLGRSSLSYNTARTSEDLEDQIKGSCLILENQANQVENKQDEKMESSDSFCKNLEKNESLVEQIHILYKKQIKYSEYSQALYIFLKWANMYQEHTYGGFLRPIYRQFYHELAKSPLEQIENIVIEVQQFGQYMVSVITQVYGLKELATSEGGRLIKNDNVYNMVMCYLFKRTKLKNFILECIRHRDHQKIETFERQLHKLSKKPISYFGVSSKFSLQQDCSIMTESEKTKSTEINLYLVPYSESLKLVEQLSQNGGPITKLKTIIAISKQIIKEIHTYYQHRRREAPELDPENLSAIVMYLLAKNGKRQIYQQLKIVDYFTTSNCLNCISGYYLSVFLAACESIIQIKEQ